MNTKEYISSGVLELYVMGSLSDSEMSEVKEMAARNPDIAAEIKEIEAILESYALSNSIEPEPALRDKVLNKIKNGNLHISKKYSPPPVQNSSTNFYRYLAAASIVLLIGSSALNFIVWKKLKQTERELTSLNNEKQEYANQLILVKSSYVEATAELNILQNKDFQSVEMKGLPQSPNSLVRVYWNRQSKEAFVDIFDLPPPPAGKQYQLWALVDGKPVDAGIFEGKPALQKVKNVDNAQAFAVTLEPEGGSQSPTMSAMYVMGNV